MSSGMRRLQNWQTHSTLSRIKEGGEGKRNPQWPYTQINMGQQVV